jgi:short-subunit dehydrogenase
MNIIITGASTGIGYQTAIELAKSGNHNIIALARNKKKLTTLKKHINKLNTSSVVDVIKIDITEKKQLDKLIKHITLKYKHINVLINNAGYLINKPFLKTGTNEIQKIFSVNYFAVCELIKLTIPLFKKSNSSSHNTIINIGSMGGYQGSTKFSGIAAYSTSKAALACLTECLAEELKEYDITINCLALGAVQTNMLAKAFPGYKAQISPAQMAEYITWFALNGAKYHNGKIIPVTLSVP